MFGILLGEKKKRPTGFVGAFGFAWRGGRELPGAKTMARRVATTHATEEGEIFAACHCLKTTWGGVGRQGCGVVRLWL